jgi:hypothetical protein
MCFPLPTLIFSMLAVVEIMFLKIIYHKKCNFFQKKSIKEMNAAIVRKK